MCDAEPPGPLSLNTPGQAKTANCFLLNGVVFGGSVLLLQYVLRPAVHLALSAVAGPGAAAAAGAALAGVYSLLWLFPAYLISFLVNCIWWVLEVPASLQGRQAAACCAAGARLHARWCPPSLDASCLPHSHRPSGPPATHPNLDTFLPHLRRYNEIAELVVAAGQRRALQQRAQRQGALLVPGAEGPVVKVREYSTG